MADFVLDISRLISRVRHTTPSGVDRVEMAYARGLLQIFGEDLAFAAVHPIGRYGRISRAVALAYLDELDHRWAQSEQQAGPRSVISVLPWMTRLLPQSRGVGTGKVLIQVSPHHLQQTAKIRDILKREKTRFVCMVHDLIPIEYPEYARPGGAALHARRMTSVAQLADAVIVNSAATKTSLARWIESKGSTPPPIHVALLGTQEVAQVAPRKSKDAKPYFLCLGTIEPRKNHLLLLHIWRQLAQSLPAQNVPRLVIVGRRGWENEQILDLLDRCPDLAPFIEEVSSCGDAELAAIVRGARSLLMPSFAEGFGMPIAEALSAGIPVIASDIAAHREVGEAAPDYYDPLDGPGWQEAILDHVQNGPVRQAQMTRAKQWKAPDWQSHIDIAAQVIGNIAR